MHLSVVIYDFAGRVDGDARVPGISAFYGRIFLHDSAKCGPHLLFLTHFLESGNLGSIKCAHELVVHEHGEAMDAVFREEDEIGGGVGPFRLADESADMLGRVGKVGWGCDGEELGLDGGDYDTTGCFV